MSKCRPSRTTLARQAMAHNTPAVEKEDDPRGRSRQIPMMSSTPISTESSLQYDGVPTPQSSSPVISTSSTSLRPMIKNRHSTSHSPTKSTHLAHRQDNNAIASSSTSSGSTAAIPPTRLPQISEFAPALNNVQSVSQPIGITSSLPPGSKRPIMDVDMSDAGSLPSAPVTPARAPRSAKRRSLGLGLGHKEDEERGSEGRDRKRGGRRGHGHGHGHGHGSGGQQAS